MISPNPFLASTAIRRHPKTPDVVFEPTLRRIVSDRSVHPHVRELAMMKIHEKSERGTLCVLVDIVDDPSPLKGITLNLGNSHPLRDIGRFIQANQSIDAELWLKSRTFPKRKRKKEPPPKTVGEYAQRRLKEITGQNFGLDRQAWRQWIVDHR